MHCAQANQLIRTFPFPKKEEFRLVDSLMHYALCVMRKSVLRPFFSFYSMEKKNFDWLIPLRAMYCALYKSLSCAAVNKFAQNGEIDGMKSLPITNVLQFRIPWERILRMRSHGTELEERS